MNKFSKKCVSLYKVNFKMLLIYLKDNKQVKDNYFLKQERLICYDVFFKNVLIND